MNAPGGSDYDLLSNDDGDGKSSIEGIASSKKQIATSAKIVLADPRGVLGIHFKELRLQPWNQGSLFDEDEINIYLRVIVADKVKWTCVLDAVRFPSTLMLDDVKHIPVELNVNNLEDARDRMSVELVGYDRPFIHNVIARKHIHIFSIVKHMYARDTLQMKRMDELVAEVDIDFCFSYGIFGYGYSNQLESKELTPTDYLTHSMFCRLEPPPNRCEDLAKDVMDCKYVGHPLYIPFTCQAKNLGDPHIAFGPNVTLHAEQIAEPTMVITRLREKLNHNLSEYAQQCTRKERIRWLKRFVFNSQFADTSKEEIIIPEGSMFRRKLMTRRTNVAEDDLSLITAAHKKSDEEFDQEAAAEKQQPTRVSLLDQIRTMFRREAPRMSVAPPEIPITTVSSSVIAGRCLSLMLMNEDKNIRFKGTEAKIETESIWRRVWRQVKSWASHIIRWHSATQEEVELQMSESERTILNTIRRHSLHSVRERKGSVLTQFDDPILGARSRRHSACSDASVSMTMVPSGKMFGKVGSVSEMSRRGSILHHMDALAEQAEGSQIVEDADEDTGEDDEEALDAYEHDHDHDHIPLRGAMKVEQLASRVEVVAEVNILPKLDTSKAAQEDHFIETGIETVTPLTRVINVREPKSSKDKVATVQSKKSVDGSNTMESEVAKSSQNDDVDTSSGPRPKSARQSSAPTAWSSKTDLNGAQENASAVSEMTPVEILATKESHDQVQDFVDYVTDLSIRNQSVLSHHSLEPPKQNNEEK